MPSTTRKKFWDQFNLWIWAYAET